MTKPIERVYVIENNLDGPMQASGFDVNPERAERFREAIKGVTRVFVEERPWITARAPDNSRLVLALYASGGVTGSKYRPMVARFGSEGKWVAESYDYSLNVLGPGTVLAWRELPEEPALAGVPFPVGWR